MSDTPAWMAAAKSTHASLMVALDILTEIKRLRKLNSALHDANANNLKRIEELENKISEFIHGEDEGPKGMIGGEDE